MSGSPAPEAALATLVHEPFYSDQWIYEPKLDGERCLASRVDHQEIVLHSRNGNVGNHSFPEVVDALAAQDAPDFVVDGEVVAFDGRRFSFARLHPDRFTVEQRKDKRAGRLYLDVIRNAYGQTAVPPYAVRAHPGAPVATPIEWEELSRVPPERYTITSVRRRLSQRADPWAGFADRAANLGTG